MRNTKKGMTTTELLDFINIKYPRFHVWMQKNILGLDDPLPGLGHPSYFSFMDACAARLVTGVMDATGNFDIAKDVVEHFRNDEQQRRAGWNIVITVINKEYQIIWAKPDLTFFKPQEPEKDSAIIIIPVAEIMDRMQNYFSKIEHERQLA